MAIDPTHIRIGTAGWAVPADLRGPWDRTETRPSALSRYATHLPAAEINSSFHRHHRPGTYERWARSVPLEFRFSIKLPKAITHVARLEPTESLPVLDRFVEEISELRFKAGPLLVQLPPSLAFDAQIVEAFLIALRARHDGAIVCEPRHPTWFESDAESTFVQHRVARVAADPAKVPPAAEVGGWRGLAYLRLHGSPRTYYSSYDDDDLDALAARLLALAAADETETVWCIFDNTASGAAFANALDLQRRIVN